MSEELSSAIRGELQRRNLSLREAAQEIGVSHATLSRLLHGLTRPDYETCAKLAGYLRLRVARVLELAGYAEAGALTGTDDPLLEEFFGRWQKLRGQDRQFVLQVMRTLLDSSPDSP